LGAENEQNYGIDNKKRGISTFGSWLIIAPERYNDRNQKNCQRKSEKCGK
jgi:hypothetical protein